MEEAAKFPAPEEEEALVEVRTASSSTVCNTDPEEGGQVLDPRALASLHYNYVHLNTATKITFKLNSHKYERPRTS